ncbi:hypothetical protein GBA52_000023 [Prunus armeniaca]|nr:hypothetical protein GBA52_000023 [Prunus armeniaca]
MKLFVLYYCCEKLDTSSSGWHKTMTEVLSKIKEMDNNHDYGYYNPNGTGSCHATTDPYHHQRYYPNYYELKAPPLRREIHPFYDPDTQCTIM